MDRWFFHAFSCPLRNRGPRLGSVCASPQLAEAWPSPSLVSLPRWLLTLMRNSVILMGVGGEDLNKKSSKLSLSFPRMWWLAAACYVVITDKILTGCYQAQQYRSCNLITPPPPALPHTTCHFPGNCSSGIPQLLPTISCSGPNFSTKQVLGLCKAENHRTRANHQVLFSCHTWIPMAPLPLHKSLPWRALKNFLFGNIALWR